MRSRETIHRSYTPLIHEWSALLGSSLEAWPTAPADGALERSEHEFPDGPRVRSTHAASHPVPNLPLEV